MGTVGGAAGAGADVFLRCGVDIGVSVTGGKTSSVRETDDGRGVGTWEPGGAAVVTGSAIDDGG